jgi:hypothetical protein
MARWQTLRECPNQSTGTRPERLSRRANDHEASSPRARPRGTGHPASGGDAGLLQLIIIYFRGKQALSAA